MHEPIEVDFEIKPIEVGKSYKLNDVYFPTNSFELNDESRNVLDGFVVFLQENPKIKVSVEGHTDNVGREEDNLKLSADRARAVYEYLISGGVSADRLSYHGFGEEKPVASNDTPEGRAKNRRTVFVITEK
jgi:outer membrane protein OmpA-like peptidoglycan-associated protein